MRKAPAVIAAALCLLLIGCSPDPVEPSPTPTAESATPKPTATVEPAVKPLLEDLVISPEGLGPIRIGQAYLPRDPATDVLAWDDTVCGFAEDPSYDPGFPDYGNWKHTYVDALEWFDPLVEVAYGATAEEPVIRITTFLQELRTEDGLGIGSTMAELQAVYGEDLIVTPDEAYYPAVVHGRTGQLVFWFAFDAPEVYMLQVLPVDEAPRWSFHRTACA